MEGPIILVFVILIIIAAVSAAKETVGGQILFGLFGFVFHIAKALLFFLLRGIVFIIKKN